MIEIKSWNDEAYEDDTDVYKEFKEHLENLNKSYTEPSLCGFAGEEFGIFIKKATLIYLKGRL